MSEFRLERNFHFWLYGREHIIEERLRNGDFKIRDVLTEEPSVISESGILKLYDEGRVQAEPPCSGGKTKGYEAADFTQIDEHLRVEAKRRYSYVNAYLEKNLQRRDEKTLTPIIKEVAEEIKDQEPPSSISLYRWIKKFEESGNNIRSLISNHRAKGDYRPKLEQEVLTIINQAINELYLVPGNSTVDDVISRVTFYIAAENLKRENHGLPLLDNPHPSTIYRRVAQIDPYEEMIKRHGRRTADREYNYSGGEPSRPIHPMEVAEIDHTQLPFYVIDEETNLPIGRPHLTSIIEKKYGIPLGYYLAFEPPSGLSVMQALWHAIRPKNYVRKDYPSVSNTWDAYGKMGILKCDNAVEFKNAEQLRDSALQVGFHIEFCPVKIPWYKSKVEGHFHAINSKLLAGQPGSFLKFAQEFDDEYNPVENAVVSLEALHEMIHIFLIDIVCQMSHPEFGTPRAELWRKAIAEFPPPLPSSNRELRVFLGYVFHRTITRNGIEFEGLYYRSDDLVALRSIYEQRDKRVRGGVRETEKAKIKIDTTDISCIHVYNPETLEFVRIPAVSQTYTKGLSLWQHRKIKKFASREAKKVDIVALSIAKEKIYDIVEREWRKAKRSGKMKAARFLRRGIDGVNPSDVEAYHNSQKPKNQPSITDSSNMTEASTSNITPGLSTQIGSISAVGNAFSPDEDFQLSTDSSQSGSLVSIGPNIDGHEPVETVASSEINEKPSRRGRSRNSPEANTGENGQKPKKQSTANQQKDSDSTRKTKDKPKSDQSSWSPDLTGWSTN